MAFSSITVESNDLNLIVSKNVLKNYYAGLSTHTGTSDGTKAGFVNANYAGEATLNTSQVVAYRFERPAGSYRVLGGGVNGGFINTNSATISENSTFALPLTYVFDEMYDIPALQQGVLNYDILQGYSENIGGMLQEFVDITTFEEVFEAVKTYTAADGDNVVTTANLSTAAIAFADLKSKIIDIRRKQSNLKFDTQNTSDRQVPVNGRVYVGVDESIDPILAEGLIIAGSEKAYLTQIEGVETETAGSFDRVEVKNNSFRGTYQGFSLFRIHDEFVPNVDNGKITAGKVYGIFSHAGATTRAISQDLAATVPGQGFLGIRLQYLRRWGVKCFKPWFAYALVSSDFAE